jgi:hypothetical protein
MKVITGKAGDKNSDQTTDSFSIRSEYDFSAGE